MEKDSKIYVAGHTGLVGSAILRKLKAEGYHNLIVRTHGQLDLTRQEETENFFKQEMPEYVIDAAALVGGIKANSKAPADYFYVNMAIENNLIWSACQYGVKKFLFLGSACMYPKECSQPMKEDELLTGLPEITNEGYALAKICGSRLCGYLRQQYGADFISVVPANAYGINDCFDPQKSHVIPALLMKYHRAKLNNDKYVELWGTGGALREFINSNDIAGASLFLMNHYSGSEPVNVGVGSEISIMELSKLIKKIVGYQGEIVCDPSKPDGMPRRIVDSTKINQLGWKSDISLECGIRDLYKWYLQQTA